MGPHVPFDVSEVTRWYTRWVVGFIGGMKAFGMYPE